MKTLILAVLVSALGWGTSLASDTTEIYVESVVMGTDGQMRTRINGEYLTRQGEKQGIRVIDINYQWVTVEFSGQLYKIKPGVTESLVSSSSKRD